MHRRRCDEDETYRKQRKRCTEQKNRWKKKRKRKNKRRESGSIPEFTEQEVQAAIDSVKKKSGDSRGIRAEDIKECDDETKKMVREIFNEVITRESITPET